MAVNENTGHAEVASFAKKYDSSNRLRRLGLGLRHPELWLAKNVEQKFGALMGQEEAQAFHSIVESQADMAFRFTPNGKILYANKAAADFFCALGQNALNSDFYGLLGSEAGLEYRKRIDDADHSQSIPKAEISLSIGNGPAAWYLCTDCAIKDGSGRIVEHQATWKDITRQKDAETALRLTEHNYRKMINNIPDIVYRIDTEGKFTFLNKEIEALGYTPEELLGRHFSEIIHPEDREHVSRELVLPVFSGIRTGDMGAPKLFDERRNGKRGTKNLLVRMIHKNWNPEAKNETKLGETVFWTEVGSRGESSISGNGQRGFNGTSGIIKDITAMKMTEEKMQTENGKLDLLLRQAQKMHVIGDLTAGVVHDSNNLVMGILGTAELTLIRAQASRDGIIAEKMEKIITACGRAAELNRQILNFARKTENATEEMDINHVVNETQKLVTVGISSVTPYRLKLQLNSTRMIKGDETQIHQVVYNLAVNARDAMPNGGTITMRTEDVETSERPGFPDLVPAGKYVKLSVIDSGTGISQANLAKVFEPFFTTKPVGKGTGLGLATVMSIVKSHNGRLNVESELGRGTAFNIYFPAISGNESKNIQATVAAANETQNTSGISENKTRSVLVIDDDEMIRELLKAMLENAGFSVTAKASAQEGLAEYMRMPVKPNVVITDVIMPSIGEESMSGVDLTKKILEIDRNANILLMSGYNQEDEKIREALNAGAKGFMGKPFRAKELAKTINAVINGGPLVESLM